ncbi:MAG TPA: mechanosensitive ion channel domain-containing protein [Sulfolobales archaeon]|nr:mechanosensitive ion channel domain-containing protein [Sulfolobales archaeon]
MVTNSEIIATLTSMLQTLYPAFYAIVILILTWVFVKAIDTAIKSLMATLPHLILSRVRKSVSAVIWFIGILLAIEQLGLRVEILLILIALAGITLIIALRDVLSNIASKYFSDIYVPYKLGDRISVAGYTGSVIEINPLVTVILTDDGKIVSIPNSYFLTSMVVNETREAWRDIAIPVLVEKGLDLAEVESEILKRINKLKARLDQRFPPTVIVRKSGNEGSELVVMVRIREPMDKEAVTSEINKRVVEAIEDLKKKAREERKH